MFEAFPGTLPPDVVDTKMARNTVGQAVLDDFGVSGGNSTFGDLKAEGIDGNRAIATEAFVFNPQWRTLVEARLDVGFALSEPSRSLTVEEQFDAPSAEGGPIVVADTVPIWGPDVDGFGFI
jgi:hypothetical protein